MPDLAAELAERARQHPIEIAEAADHRCVGGAHSYLSDGRVVCWTPGPPRTGERFAIDAEIARQQVPPALGRVWACTDPALVWPRWCVTEVVAKLVDVPVVTLVRRAGDLASPIEMEGRTVHWRIREVDGIVVALGVGLPC